MPSQDSFHRGLLSGEWLEELVDRARSDFPIVSGYNE
jgi:hypothetical protein